MEEEGLSMIAILGKQINDRKRKEKWKQIPIEMMSRLGKNLCCFSSDVSVKYFKGLGLIKNTFWRKVLSCWLDNKQKWSAETPAKTALEKQCLWNNRT